MLENTKQPIDIFICIQDMTMYHRETKRLVDLYPGIRFLRALRDSNSFVERLAFSTSLFWLCFRYVIKHVCF